MAPSDPPAVEALLADVDWVRGLARGLVRDALAAEDVAQEAWVAALESERSRVSSLRAWLACVTRNTVLKRHRTESRRQAREQSAARADRAPSTSHVVESFSVRLAVAQAVHALDEPYRETLLLRYYEELTLAQISERLDVPLPTVAARVQRGLDALRRRLERELGGDGRSWVVLLLPLLEDGPRTDVVAGSATGVTVRVVLAIVTVIGVGASIALAALAGDVTEPDGLRALGHAPGVRVPQFGNDSGSHDGVLVRAAPRPRRDVRIPSDASDVPSADERPTAAAVPLDPPPVETGEATLVVGRVVDRAGEPVPGAGVWMSSSGCETLVGGRVVAAVIADAPAVLADAHGAFRLEVSGAAPTIGARAASFAPSLPYVLSRPGGASTARALDIVLPGPGADLIGRVVLPDGTPVAGASVFVDLGSITSTLADGRRYGRRMPEVRTRTDRQGAFHVTGLRSGIRTVLVRARQLAPWRERVELLPFEETELHVELREGMSIAGAVTDAGGEPLADVAVWTTRRRWSTQPDERYAIETRSAADGSYRIDGLEPGVCWISVDGGALGNTTATRVGRRGEVLGHDVVLTPGTELRGRVVDARRAGLSGVLVRARPREDWRVAGEATTDERGAFAIAGLRDAEYRLQILERGWTVASRVHVRARPGSRPTEISITDARRPTVVVTGVAVGEAGTVAPRAVRIEDADGTLRRDVAVAKDPGGGFRTDSFPTGTWRLTWLFDDHPSLPADRELRLEAFELHDVGRLRLPPTGSVVVDLRPAGALHDLRVSAVDGGGRIVHDLRIAGAEVSLPLKLPLGAGPTQVRVRAAGFAPAVRDVHVREGEAQRIQITLEPGTARTLRFHATEPARDLARIALSLSTTDGETLLEDTLFRSPSASEASFATTVDLLPGVYRFDVRERGALCATGVVTVAEGQPESDDIQLSPR